MGGSRSVLRDGTVGLSPAFLLLRFPVGISMSVCLLNSVLIQPKTSLRKIKGDHLKVLAGDLYGQTSEG